MPSVQPKTVNAFQRVKVDAVKFADNRLQDNSYWAKVLIHFFSVVILKHAFIVLETFNAHCINLL